MRELTELSVLIPDLALGAIATFIAIMLWSLTREPAWMLVVVSVVLNFSEVVFQSLDRFGIVSLTDTQFLGIPVFWVVLRAAPWIFLILGLLAMVRALRS